jgi:hypothetical protein
MAGRVVPGAIEVVIGDRQRLESLPVTMCGRIAAGIQDTADGQPCGIGYATDQVDDDLIGAQHRPHGQLVTQQLKLRPLALLQGCQRRRHRGRPKSRVHTGCAVLPSVRHLQPELSAWESDRPRSMKSAEQQPRDPVLTGVNCTLIARGSSAFQALSVVDLYR